MPRIYTVQFNNVSVSAAQDLFAFVPADDKPIELVGVVITDRDSETNEQRTITIQRRSTPTFGSGGSTPTPVAVFSADTAAGFTAHANDTTRASAGTASVIHAEGYPSQGGFAFVPIPGCEPKCLQTEILIVGLEVAPAAATAMNGTAYIRELP